MGFRHSLAKCPGYSCSTFVYRVQGFGFVPIGPRSLSDLVRVRPCFPCFAVSHFVATLSSVVHIPSIGPSEQGHCLSCRERLTSYMSLAGKYRVIIGSSAEMGSG